MTSGSAPSANDPESASSTAPSDGLMLGMSSTDQFVLTPDELGKHLQNAFQQGWSTSRLLPDREAIKLEFQVEVDHETRKVNVTAVIL